MFEILEQARNRFVGITRMVSVILDQVSMSIPIRIVVIATGINLYEAYSPFDHAPGKEAFSAEIFGFRTIYSVQAFDMFGFLIDIHCLGGGCLHFVSELIRCDSGG